MAWGRFRPGAIHGLRLLLVVNFSAGFSPGFPVFLPSQKPTSPNFSSTRIEDPHENQLRLICLPSKYFNFILFIYYYVFSSLLHFCFCQPFAAGRGSPSSSASTFDDVDSMSSSVERPRLRLGYRTLSSSSMKAAASPIKDENRADNPNSPEHHTKIPTPTKTTQSPRGGQTRFGYSPRATSSSFHKDSNTEVETVSSNESLDGRYVSPPPPHRGDGAPHQADEAPSVSSGYNSDDVTSGHAESNPQASAAAEPASTGAPAGHKYDPRQYQDQQNDFHPVSKLPMVRY